jgi:hypothetical protein
METKMEDKEAVTGLTGWLHLAGESFSKIVRVSPFGRVRRKPEPTAGSGETVASEYSHLELVIPRNDTCVKFSDAGLYRDSVVKTSPRSPVKLLAKPVSLSRTDLSADTNQTITGTCSVTHLCSTKSASLEEIMLALMTESLGEREAIHWCKELGFLA